MVSQSFLTAYFWGAYFWFWVGFLIVAVAAIKEIINIIFRRKDF